MVVAVGTVGIACLTIFLVEYSGIDAEAFAERAQSCGRSWAITSDGTCCGARCGMDAIDRDSNIANKPKPAFEPEVVNVAAGNGYWPASSGASFPCARLFRASSVDSGWLRCTHGGNRVA